MSVQGLTQIPYERSRYAPAIPVRGTLNLTQLSQATKTDLASIELTEDTTLDKLPTGYPDGETITLRLDSEDYTLTFRPWVDGDDITEYNIRIPSDVTTPILKELAHEITFRWNDALGIWNFVSVNFYTEDINAAITADNVRDDATYATPQDITAAITADNTRDDSTYATPQDVTDAIDTDNVRDDNAYLTQDDLAGIVSNLNQVEMPTTEVSAGIPVTIDAEIQETGLVVNTSTAPLSVQGVANLEYELWVNGVNAGVSSSISGSYPVGTSIIIEASVTDPTVSDFRDWGEGTETAQISFTLTGGGQSFVPRTIPVYLVNVSPVSNMTFDVDIDGATTTGHTSFVQFIRQNSEITLTAEPDNGYDFVDWGGDGAGDTDTVFGPFMLTGGVTLSPTVQLAGASMTETDLGVVNNNHNAILWNHPDNATVSEITLNLKGCLAHQFYHGSDTEFIHYMDAMGHMLWDETWSNSAQSHLDHIYTKVPEVLSNWPGNGTDVDGMSHWVEKSSDTWVRFGWHSRTNGWKVQHKRSTGDMLVQSKSCILAMKFNSSIGFIPVPLLPYLSASATFANNSFIPPAWMNGSWSQKTVGDAKSTNPVPGTGLEANGNTFDEIGNGDSPRNYDPTETLFNAVTTNSAVDSSASEFNPYSFNVDLDAIEALYSAAGSRLTQWEFAVISSDMTKQVLPGIDGVTSSFTAHGAFKISLTHQ